MADTQIILSVVTTTASRLSELSIKNGQLIFIKDSQKVALDFDDKRTFYNQIVVLQTDTERQELLAPVSGLFYFVIETPGLWYYDQTWVEVASSGEDGFSPIITENEDNDSDTYKLDITTKAGSFTTPNLKGSTGNVLISYDAEQNAIIFLNSSDMTITYSEDQEAIIFTVTNI